MRLRDWAAAAVAAVAAWGCGPPEMVPVMPPGIEVRQITPEKIPEDEAAQALGEARGTTPETVAPPTAAAIEPIEPTEPGQPRRMDSGLIVETLQPGSGPGVKSGQRVTVHYTGTLEDGSVFDSSRDRGDPFTFRLGFGEVIRGWDLGVTGMQIGERRKLIIPSELAYGSRSPSAKIPPDSTLIFDIELIRAQ
jgi:peptidylprolyl isomerase